MKYQVHFYDKGYFIVDDMYVFEVGVLSKKEKQLQGNKNSYIVSDDLEMGFEKKIPR